MNSVAGRQRVVLLAVLCGCFYQEIMAEKSASNQQTKIS